MNEDILRVKRDLETISTAAGLEKPPLTWRSVKMMCINGTVGLVLTVYCVLLGGIPLEALAMVFIPVTLLQTGLWYYASKLDPTRTARTERTFQYTWPKLLMGTGLIVCCGFWVVRYMRFDVGTGLGAYYLFCGGLTAVVAIVGKWAQCFWGMAIPYLIASMVAPEIPPEKIGTLLSLTLCVSGYLPAAINAWLLLENKE